MTKNFEENHVKSLLDKVTNGVVRDRIDNFLTWSLYKCRIYERNYIWFSICTIIINAIIPIVVLLDNISAVSIVVSFLSATSGVLGSIIFFRGWKDKLNRYRKYIERIKHEMYIFANGIEDYQNVTAEQQQVLLASRIEKLIMSENEEWIRSQEIKSTD